MNAGELPELQPVWAALRRGTKLHRLRLLVVRCPNGHRLCQVFHTERGPVAVGQVRLPETIRPGYPDSHEPTIVGWFSRDAWWAVNLDDPDAGDEARFQCRCREACIPVRWLREQLASGLRRARWTHVRT